MPVNAIQSLIRICGAAESQSKHHEEECPPVASLGFWASSSVPLSAGVDSVGMKPLAKTMQHHPTPAPLLPSLPFAEELEVRDRLATAKELAEVGDDIRWDLIIEEAAKLPCGLRGGAVASPVKKASACDDDDRRSTSASGSGGDEATIAESEEFSSADESEGRAPSTPLFGSKLPPWRRSRKSSGDSSGNEGHAALETDSVAALPPWRRGAAATGHPATACKISSDASSRVYAITTLLQCWSLMQKTSLEQGNTIPTSSASAAKEHSMGITTPAALTTTSGAKEVNVSSKRTDLADAPWRRHRPATMKPQAVSED